MSQKLQHVDAQDNLIAEQERNFALMNRISRLRELNLTTRIAARNLRKLMPQPHPDVKSIDNTLFQRDRERGLWLTEQIQMDLGYLNELRQRISAGHKMATLVVERRAEKTARRLKNLVLMQASFIGAIALGLAAVQAFIPQTVLHWALITLLMAIALTLPVFVERWHERYTAIDRIVGGISGAATLFVLATLADRFWLHLKVPSVSFVSFSVVCSLIGFFLGYFAVGRLQKLKGNQARN